MLRCSILSSIDGILDIVVPAAYSELRGLNVGSRTHTNLLQSLADNAIFLVVCETYPYDSARQRHEQVSHLQDEKLQKRYTDMKCSTKTNKLITEYGHLRNARK